MFYVYVIDVTGSDIHCSYCAYGPDNWTQARMCRVLREKMHVTVII